MADKKRITYLLGAGATQAEVSIKNPAIRVVMSEITSSIHLRIRSENILELETVANQLADPNVDVEHLITLYESSGSYAGLGIAGQLKRLFREEIQKKIKLLGDDFYPTLMAALIDMHNVRELPETLQGILTLNYDELIENAMQKIRGGIDYGMVFDFKTSKFRDQHSKFPLLKLHGSFNWKNEFPVSVVEESEISADEEYLWIPPGVEKKREKYPFSLLWNRARRREVLLCDTLRVVGCSLSRNDWELISLLFTTQNLNARGDKYEIEIIDFEEAANDIKGNYAYLQFKTVLEIEEVREYLSQGKKEIDAGALREYVSRSNTRANIFELWLRAKGDALRKSGSSLRTKKRCFLKFLDEA